jgi:hypothetical protein
VRSSESTPDGDAAPIPADPARRAMRRIRAAITALVVLASLAVAAVAVARVPQPPEQPTGPHCADVAQSVGLNFVGQYGPVLPALDRYGTLMQENMGNGAAVGDYNGDGYLDVLLLGQAGQHSRLFRNDPGPDGTRHFTDVTDAAGLGGVTSNARVAQFVDLGGTGRPDLVIAADYLPGGPAGPSQIFRNNGDGTFTDVTAGSGFDPTGYLVGGMTFADYDGSGRQSIYLSYWTDEANADPARRQIQGEFPGHDRLYRNLGNYHFEDVTDTAFVEEYHADSFTAVFADFTGDGRPDIYQANDNRPDRFYRNNGDGTFTDPGYADGLTRDGNSMGVATTVGPTGDLRMFITNITDPSGLFGSNVGNTFIVPSQDATGMHFSNEVDPYGFLDTAWGWGTAFVDVNLDGAPDLYAVQGMHAYVGDQSEHLANATSTLFLNDGTSQRFIDTPAAGCDVPGDQRALVAFDYNRDGSPDLLITQVAGPALLLQNTITGRHWLTVTPQGPNDAGIDARITVTAGGRSSQQILLAGGSYLAGPPREAYFGLGAAATADLVRVQWANGGLTELHNVAADQVLRITPP